MSEIDHTLSRSKYRRPRAGISWFGLILGFIVGVGGALYYAWVLAPIQEVNTAPWQLRREDKQAYIVAIVLNYTYDTDLNGAFNRLLAINPPDRQQNPFEMVAQTACELASGGYVSSSSGLSAVQSMMRFYQPQMQTGCADAILPAPLPVDQQQIMIEAATPTLLPPETKTPTPPGGGQPSPTSRAIFTPTPAPQRAFAIARMEDFCSAAAPAVAEVYVQDFNGDGIPGMPVRVRWIDGDDTFVTGLQPERGPSYADFVMEPNVIYTIEMPDRSEASQPFSAAPCTTETGESSLTSYRIVFRPLE